MAQLQSQKYRTCIDACNECFEACEMCAAACMHEENVKSLAKCVEISVMCYHTCAATSLILSAKSEYAKKLLGLVAEICEDCAEECEKHQHAEYCKLTAESCRKCAEECRRVSAK